MPASSMTVIVAELFSLGFLAGLALAIPLGPMALMLISTTVSRGWRYGVVGGAGMALVDFLYAFAVFFLGSAIVRLLDQFQSLLVVVGSMILIALGVVTATKNLRELKQPTNSPTKQLDQKSLLGTLGVFMAATVVNPPTALYFLAITPAVTALAHEGWESPLVFSFGVLIGSGIWQQLVAVGGLGLRKLSGPKARAIIGILGGALMVVLAIGLMIRGLA